MLCYGRHNQNENVLLAIIIFIVLLLLEVVMAKYLCNVDNVKDEFVDLV